jgi:hypothetical protein
MIRCSFHSILPQFYPPEAICGSRRVSASGAVDPDTSCASNYRDRAVPSSDGRINQSRQTLCATQVSLFDG